MSLRAQLVWYWGACALSLRLLLHLNDHVWPLCSHPSCSLDTVIIITSHLPLDSPQCAPGLIYETPSLSFRCGHAPLVWSEKKKVGNQSGTLLPTWNCTSDWLGQPKWGWGTTVCNIEKEGEGGRGRRNRLPNLALLLLACLSFPLYKSRYHSTCPEDRLYLKWYTIKSGCIVGLTVITTSLLMNNGWAVCWQGWFCLHCYC